MLTLCPNSITTCEKFLPSKNAQKLDIFEHFRQCVRVFGKSLKCSEKNWVEVFGIIS